MSTARIFEILLVEDSPTDRLLAQSALSSAQVLNNVSCVSDGVEAIEFLRREGKHKEAPRPDLVLLDLNLPRKSGHEVLSEIKADPTLCVIPVVVLTTSTTAEEITRVYGQHANSMIAKPIDFQQFTRIVQHIGQYWFAIVKLPPKA